MCKPLRRRVNVKNEEDLVKAIDEVCVKSWYLGKKIDNLRTRVLAVHAAVESHLEMIIIDHLLEIVSYGAGIATLKYPKNKAEDYSAMLTTLIDRMNFAQKLNSPYVANKIDKHLAGHIYRLNKARNILAHPNIYECKIFNDKKVYLQALIDTLASINGIAQIKTPYLSKLLDSMRD